jgi:hypothetical protein
VACSSVSVSTRARRILSLTLKASPRLPLLLLRCRRRLSTEEVRPSHLPPSTSAQPHFSCNADPPQPSPTTPSPTYTAPPTPQAPSPPHARSHTGACTPARPPPRGERTLPCLSVCAAGVLYGEGVGLTGVGAGLWAGRGCGKLGGRGRGLTRIRQACARGG